MSQESWMGRNFFTGGTVPSARLFLYFNSHLCVNKVEWISGTNYQRTLNAWWSRLQSRPLVQQEAMTALLDGEMEKLLERERRKEKAKGSNKPRNKRTDDDGYDGGKKRLSVIKNEAKREAAYAYQRWRLFYLMCAELFGMRGGKEWGVAYVTMSARQQRAESEEA